MYLILKNKKARLELQTQTSTVMGEALVYMILVYIPHYLQAWVTFLQRNVRSFTINNISYGS